MGDGQRTRAARLRRLIVGYRLSQALSVAAKLGIADRLTGGPASVEALAEATRVHAPSLYRVLRLLASEGVFAEIGGRRFELTPLARPLLSDAPDSLRARAIFDGEELNWRPWGNLLESVRTGASAFDHTYGAPIFDYLKENTVAAAAFDELMAVQTRPWADAVVEAHDFSGLDLIVDVGGGYGVLLSAILAAHPEMRGVIFDMPHVVAGARSSLDEAGLGDRCEAVGGDFFQTVPEGGDAYLLKHVLHDWDDARCKTILGRIRSAIPGHGRLLVIEILVAAGNEPDYGKFLDLNMLALTNGRERTEAEYCELIEATGFALTRVVPTRSELSVVEATPV